MKEFLGKNIFFIIPARENSKGFPFKNRKLLDYTITQIPTELQEQTIVTTDDEEIIKKLINSKIKILKRDEKLCLDETSTKEVILNVIEEFNIKKDSTIILLYLTEPNRKFTDVKKIFSYYKMKDATTLTCCVEPKSHPFLCLYKIDGEKGEQIVKHDLYRRQDYPECIEIRHFVCIFKVDEINNLNQNLYNEKTIYYKIDDDDIDVDYETDFEKFKSKHKK